MTFWRAAPPPRRPRLWGEILAVVWLCWVYDAVTNLAPLRWSAARAHAAAVLHLEAVVHVDPEASLDHWLVSHHTVAIAVANYYDNAHFVVTFGVLAFLWWRRPDVYRPLRTTLVLTNVAALAVFWLYPTAPPRLLSPARYPDIVAATGAFGSWHSGTLATAADQLAAMPSLHLAWAAWCALAIRRIVGPRRWASAVWLYPAVTGVAVVSTGNHFVLDAAAGGATLALATFAVDRWPAYGQPEVQPASIVDLSQVPA